MEELKAKARERGLWNLFLPESEPRRRPHQPRVRAALRDHGPLAHRRRDLQLLGARHRQHGGARALRPAPSTRSSWLEPLLDGKIRSAFAMTEPKVASSDATNIESSIVRDGDEYVINGHKWWTSGIGDPRCKILIFMGKTDPKNPDRYKQQSMILVPRETARHQGRAHAHRLRLRRRAPRPRRGAVRERARAGRQHAARRGPRLRDRAGPARPRPHPPLHAPDRRGRARARADVQARAQARGVRQAAGRERHHPRAHRPVAGSRSTRRACSCCTRPT